MANRGDLHAIMGAKDNLHLITATLVGNTTNAMTVAESAQRGAGEIVSCARADTGDFTIVFRHSYPELKSIVGLEFVGATAGLQARFTAIDVAAKTAAFTVEVGATPTDPATTDTLHIALLVRNSGFNK